MASAAELARAVELAARLYQSAFRGPSMAAAHAKGYLADRRMFGPAIDAFRIGFAPRGGPDFLIDRMRGDFSVDVMVEAGLLVEGKNGLVDPMAGRVVFPQATPQGQVVGFLGRAIDPDVPEAYKYVATPLTQIFRRFDLVYRIDLVYRNVMSEGKAVVVEGPMDAVLLWQIGQRNAVAVGTKKMTDAQAQILARYARRLEVMFDTGIEEDKAFDQLRRFRGHYFESVDRRQIPSPYGDPAEYVRAMIDRRLTG